MNTGDALCSSAPAFIHWNFIYSTREFERRGIKNMETRKWKMGGRREDVQTLVAGGHKA
jgi:hypothetical protein